jgi:hypothetical protein
VVAAGFRVTPVGGCHRLAAHPAIVGGRRPRASRPDRRDGRARVARRRQEQAGPLVAPRLLPGRRRPDPNERSRGLPLAGEVMRWLITNTGILTYSPSIVAASAKVLEESATPDMQSAFVSVAARTARSARSRRRRAPAPAPADAAAVARLCRGQVERAGRGAGDQPALPVGGNRPARHRRQVAARPADLRRTHTEAVRPGREPARHAGADRRRIARLRAAQRRHLLSRRAAQRRDTCRRTRWRRIAGC